MFGDTDLIKKEKDYRKRAALEETDEEKQYEVELDCQIHLSPVNVVRKMVVTAKNQDEAEEKAIDSVCDNLSLESTEIDDSIDVDINSLHTEILGLVEDTPDNSTLEMFTNATNTDAGKN